MPKVGCALIHRMHPPNTTPCSTNSNWWSSNSVACPCPLPRKFSPAYSAVETKQLIDRLLQQLAAFDTAAEGTFERLMQIAGDQLSHTKLVQVQNAIRRYDYETAHASARELAVSA